MRGEAAMRAQINNGPVLDCVLVAEQDVEMVYTDGATEPDLDWQTTDAAGHFHAYTADGKLPTLTAHERRVPCDGSCGGICGGEGYMVTEYTCVICGKAVTAGWKRAANPVMIPGPERWSVIFEDAEGAIYPVGHKVSVVILNEDDQVFAFGVARLGEIEIRATGNRQSMSMTLVGVGPLGRRKVALPADR